MMAINCPHPPRKYYKNNNNGIKEFDFFALIALGVSIYIATLARRNLEYNKRNSETSKKIAEELSKLNNSCLIKDIRTQLYKEEQKSDIKS